MSADTPAEQTPTQPVATPLPPEVPTVVAAPAVLAVSPTGKAVVPPWVTKAGTFAVLLAGAVILEGPEMGLVLPAMLMPWVKLVYLGGTVLGIVSPGWRKSAGAQ